MISFTAGQVYFRLTAMSFAINIFYEKGAWFPKPHLVTFLPCYLAGVGVAGALVTGLSLLCLLPSQANELPATETPNTTSIAITTFFI
jgi:hypothetical protein